MHLNEETKMNTLYKRLCAFSKWPQVSVYHLVVLVIVKLIPLHIFRNYSFEYI